MLSMVRTSAKRRRPQRPEFADTTVWEVAHFERRLSTGHANVVITSLRKCTRGGVIVINSPLNLPPYLNDRLDTGPASPPTTLHSTCSPLASAAVLSASTCLWPPYLDKHVHEEKARSPGT